MKKVLTCIIVDDEPAAIRLLEKYTEKVSFLDLQKSFTKPLEALAYIETHDVNVVFMDIQMPELTGIQLSKIINKDIEIIFTTAYPEFALESYDVSATDYLLKPIEFERFYKAVLKLQAPDSKKNTLSVPSEKFYFFKTDGKNKFKKVFLEDILYVEGLKNYVSVQLKTEQIITYNTLKHIYKELPQSQFVQIHKSYIISIKHIDKIENDAVWIDKQQLPIGNTYRKGFFEKINNKQL